MKVHVIDGNGGIVVMVMAVIRVAVMIRKQYLSDCLMVFMVLVLVSVLKVDIMAFLLSTITSKIQAFNFFEKNSIFQKFKFFSSKKVFF